MVSYGPFAQRTLPSGATGWISDRYRRSMREYFQQALGFLDTEMRQSIMIWRGADPSSVVGYREPARDSLIQATGAAEQMTIELRKTDDNGVQRLYALGRDEPAEDIITLIPIDIERAVLVASPEVFAVDEAAEIFYSYALIEAIPDDYVLREVDPSEIVYVPREGPTEADDAETDLTDGEECRSEANQFS